MLRVGLTGGVASGKSTVASMLRHRDCPVLDADVIGHELLESGQDAYNETVAAFGKEILDEHQNIDRKILGKIVFGDPAKLKRLNEILHPRIRHVVQNWFAALANSDPPEVAVVEAALLIEAGFRPILDKLVVCWCLPEQQIERMLERGLTPAQAEQRLTAQMPTDEKRKLADVAIDCSGSVEQTESQVAAMLDAWKREALSR